MEEGASFFDLAPHVKLRVRGADAARFLNGQLTNALSKATPDAAVEACVLNAKGRIDAHLFVFLDEAGYCLTATPEQRESLPARLERYIIADDVLLQDITDEFSLFHLVGIPPPATAALAISVHRLMRPGIDVWIQRERTEEFRRELSRIASFQEDPETERDRIIAGIPIWGRELTPEIIPLEANLEERCIDYGKGCYIGQEVISRMKMSGQTNKRLCGLRLVKGDSLREGEGMLPLQGEKEAGWVTSVTTDDRGKQIGLGYVRRGFYDGGTSLRLHREPASEVEVVALAKAGV